MKTICIVLLLASVANADRFARVFDYDWPGQHTAVQYELPDLAWQSPPVGSGFAGTYNAGNLYQGGSVSSSQLFAISGLDPQRLPVPFIEFTVTRLLLDYSAGSTHVTSSVLFHSAPASEPSGFVLCAALVVSLAVYGYAHYLWHKWWGIK